MYTRYFHIYIKKKKRYIDILIKTNNKNKAKKNKFYLNIIIKIYNYIYFDLINIKIIY